MSKLYELDSDYSERTAAETAELVPQVLLPADYLTAGMILRGQLAGKTSKAEGPASMRLQVSVSPPVWGPNHAYAVGDLVVNDTTRKYECTTAGTSDTSGGPTGVFTDIEDNAAVWKYVREVPVVLDTEDVALDEGEHTDTTWLLEFQLHMRPARRMGSAVHVWPWPMLGFGRYSAGNIAAPILLPRRAPYQVLVEPAQANVLHVLYTPEIDTMAITCMAYTLEVL
jgi:hypothetical protein